MSLSKEDLKAGASESDPTGGCGAGCLAAALACAAIDAVAVYALWKAAVAVAEFSAMLMALMAA